MTLAWAAVVVAVGALAQSISGIGFALVSGPLLFTVFGAREGVRVAVVLSMLVNVGVLAREHRAVMVRRVLPVAIQNTDAKSYGAGVDGLLGMSFLSRFEVQMANGSIEVRTRRPKK